MKKKAGVLAGAVVLVLAVAVIFLTINRRGVREYPQTMHVANDICRIRAGAGEEFEVVGLLAKGERVMVLERKAGKDGQIWYRLDTSSLAEELELSGEEVYIRSDLLVMN